MVIFERKSTVCQMERSVSDLETSNGDILLREVANILYLEYGQRTRTATMNPLVLLRGSFKPSDDHVKNTILRDFYAPNNRLLTI